MENNPSEAVPPTGESGENVSQGEETQGAETKGAEQTFNDTLKAINEATGREYKNPDDAFKGIKETYKFVGEVGQLKEKAQKWDAHESQKTDQQKSSDLNSEYYSKVDKMEFLQKNPDASSVMDDVYAISKARGISMDEAYQKSTLKKVVETDKKANEAANPPYVESAQRIQGSTGGLSREEFRNLPLVEKKKIVESLPRWRQAGLPSGVGD